MIGLVGTKEMATDGMMWYNSRRGLLYETCKEECMGTMDYKMYQYQLMDGLQDVKTADGF